MDFSLLLCSALWFFLPALVANQSPGFARKLGLRWSRTPVWERRLGPGKTWGAYYAGPLGAFATLYIQQRFPGINAAIGLFDYDRDIFIAAAALGFGAVLGDHVKSLFKRRRNIAPGARWWPWDQTDFVFGSIAISALTFVWIGWLNTMIIIVFVVCIHPIGNRIGYELGLRDVPW